MLRLCLVVLVSGALSGCTFFFDHACSYDENAPNAVLPPGPGVASVECTSNGRAPFSTLAVSCETAQVATVWYDTTGELRIGVTPPGGLFGTNVVSGAGALFFDTPSTQFQAFVTPQGSTSHYHVTLLCETQE